MDRVQLTALLCRQGDVYEACRSALASGASFDISDSPLPASHFAAIYRRREVHTRKRDIPTLGFAQAVEALYASGEEPLQVGAVWLADPSYYFQLFLSAGKPAVVACINLDQRHQAGRRVFRRPM
ncbi:hypothetical protein [Micromonospora sp. URMC 103]|uniref:hypothetical protein n=1 Tax=Micromonospora sp. URMC 103 TaxID=3423406 RepID=UPI003F1B0AD3